MGKLGYGYGSEWHLLRYLGRHRERFNKEIIIQAGLCGNIEWFDFDLTEKGVGKEWKGLDFLCRFGSKYRKILEKWRNFWPQIGNPPNWDAVGKLYFDNKKFDILLVEAKAHVGEIVSDCKAKYEGGRKQIQDVMKKFKEDMGITNNRDFLTHYYQYANRLVVLNFLNRNSVPARLISIYFYGDRKMIGAPRNIEGWCEALKDQKQYIDLSPQSTLLARIHKVFLPVMGGSKQ